MARADAAEAKLQETKTQLQAAQGERDGLKTQVGDLSKTLQGLQSQLAAAGQLKDQVTALTKERDAAVGQLKDQVSSITKERDAAVGQLKDQVNAIAKERDTAMAKVTDAQTTIDKLKSQVQEQIQKFLAIEEQNKKLQAMIDDLQKKLNDLKVPQIPGF
jgi:chromosome segregation ATPase